MRGGVVYMWKSFLNNILILGHMPNEDVKKAKRGHAKEKNLENGTVMSYTHYKSTESMNYTDKCGQTQECM